MSNILYSIRHFITNAICGLIYSRITRQHVRAALNAPLLSIKAVIKKDCGIKHPKYTVITGFRGRNLLIKVNDKYIYKYPAKDLRKGIDIREKEIVEELAKISPIYIPVPKLIKFKSLYIRRYDFITGLSLRQLIKKIDLYNEHKQYLATQVATFMVEIAKYNPKNLFKYKQSPTDTPDFMCGWHHTDLLDNFLIDPKTFKILAFIDWEEVEFGDFSNSFRDKNPILNDFMQLISKEYKRIYSK